MELLSGATIVSGVLVDPIQKLMQGVEVEITNGKIVNIVHNSSITEPFIIPGFIDAHVHIESSMLIPSQFANVALKHGTVAVVADPHEVANVAGIEGIEFMVQDARLAKIKFFFGVPSCVPASPLEKSGAVLGPNSVNDLLQRPDFYFLAEMMNFPGVISNDPEVLMKLECAKVIGKPIDGHAPGLNGVGLKHYADSGISTDHECTTIQEAEEKILSGIKILIREGSAARNFDELIPLVDKYPDMVMFCSDDCHPDYLLKGHINSLASRAISYGHNIYDVLKATSINPITHYKLPVGMLRIGDSADFVVVSSLSTFDVLATYVNGINLNKVHTPVPLSKNLPPTFSFRTDIPSNSFDVIAKGSKINVISAIDGELYTEWEVVEHGSRLGDLVPFNTDDDLLKIVLLDRYSNSPPSVGFIKGFGMRYGALATSVAHDSHHILSIGCNDNDIYNALHWVVQSQGGICFATSKGVNGIELPYFGLMCNSECDSIARQYHKLNSEVVEAGSTLEAPFMTASFMALTVIPKLKINHKGLFDSENFKSVPLFTNL